MNTLNNLIKECLVEELLNQKTKKPKKEKYLGVRIVILQRGWVFIGRLSQLGLRCRLESAYCIRKWGTTKGLGELALNGKLPDTILDYSGVVEFHKLTEICNIVCDDKKWDQLF